MKFWKMNGTGNDFIIINNIEEHIPQEKLPVLAQRLCERHMSLGADGFIVIDGPSKDSGADFRMFFYNSDGSLGEMCGNGARCISRYGYEKGLSGEKQVIETTAGIVTGERITDELYKIRLNDPEVIRTGIMLEVDPAYGSRSGAAGVSDKQRCGDGTGACSASMCSGAEAIFGPDCLVLQCSYIELGDPGIPHLVTEYGSILRSLCGAPGLEDADESVLRAVGRALRHHSSLPKGANVNFCEVTGGNEVLIRTFERGVEDFTYACGTGTGCSAVALTLAGRLTGSGMVFHMRGGTMSVDIEEINEYGDEEVSVHGLMLTGPTNIVAKGEITDSVLGKLGLI